VTYEDHGKKVYFFLTYLRISESFHQLKSTVFWDMTPFNLVEDYRRFVGTYCLHLKGAKIKPSKQKAHSSWLLCLLLPGCFLNLFFNRDGGGTT
jgi:hypothetical protein